ncbi:MAG TPA: hypothetical protein VJL89_04940 [Thermodesulfovibrionia bacterium]|nr:hypothetical protein [Thermodesulfovibrionia bacterium]
MAQLIIELPELYYKRLEQESQRLGEAIENLIVKWISELPSVEDNFDIASDPLYNFEGFESKAPEDLSINADDYLY